MAFHKALVCTSEGLQPVTPSLEQAKSIQSAPDTSISLIKFKERILILNYFRTAQDNAVWKTFFICFAHKEDLSQ